VKVPSTKCRHRCQPFLNCAGTRAHRPCDHNSGMTQLIVHASTVTLDREGWCPLVAIQGQGDGTPFFCVHGAMGSVDILQGLAKHMGNERPFYGLQAQGIDGMLQPLERVEDIAAQYVAAIRRIQAHGPYLLGGYSGGGAIAFEMAQQLLGVGEETAFLALLDTYAPLVPERRFTWRERAHSFARLGPLYVWNKIKGVVEARAYKRNIREIDSYVARGLVIPPELRELRMWNEYVRTQKRYRPKIYAGRLTLFRASEILAIDSHAGPFLCWEGLAGDGIEVHEVPGGHRDFLLEPTVARLAEALNGCLRAADLDRFTETQPAANANMS
jgi:thioesterase domain-containing protein